MGAELVEWAKASGLYGQRWKVETVISGIKRKFGDGVRSRKLRLARREVLAKGVVYNLHRCLSIVVCIWLGVVGLVRRASVVIWVSSQQSISYKKFVNLYTNPQQNPCFGTDYAYIASGIVVSTRRICRDARGHGLVY